MTTCAAGGRWSVVGGRWSVVFFYPADFTFVCPTELGDRADHYDRLQAIGVEVYSVSTATHFTHKAWHDSSDTIAKITYPMLGDPTGGVTYGFGAMRDGQGLAEQLATSRLPSAPWRGGGRRSEVTAR
jgi:alkyl hydroperoxide reductase subunit AhpC